ncbi:carboxypeptidase-like regulatory domain-containing protein [Maribacter algicola]|uniref:Carboxypeptidase-like regulatory domain-containing protein n=1 Tax=Meishania litoralis TaxID=3434685 RepID=A0ACC7LGI3_9FLAO
MPKIIVKLLTAGLLIASSMGNAQTLTSIVLDSATQKPIPYVTVQLKNKGMITNEEGRFTFLLDKNVKPTDSLIISCIGYETIGKPINQFAEKTILLRPKAIELKNVIVSNKQYTAEEIIELVNDNIEKNYSSDLTKKRLFFRKSSFQRMNKTDYTLKKSTIAAFNKKFIDSVIQTVPKSNSYYTEVLGDLYGNYDNEKQKFDLIKASELYDKSMEVDLEKLEEKFNKIIKENIKTDSYFKIKSGLFGTKVDADELFDNEVDSTDVAALNKELEEKKKNEEERKKNFARYRRNTLGDIFNSLPIREDTYLNFLSKSRRYEFTLKDFTYMGNDAVYVIDFKPKRSEDYRGTLFINSDDFALVRVDYENVKSVKSFKLLGISMNTYLSKGKIIFQKEADKPYGLRYFESEIGNRMGIKRPLKIIEKNRHVKGRNKQNELSGNIDLAFTSIDKNEVVVFETEQIAPTNFEAFEENNSILPTYMPNYDPEFWKGYNIMEPNTAIKEFTSQGESVK